MRWPILIFTILGGCEHSCSCVQSHPPADEPVSEAAAAEIADAAAVRQDHPNVSPSVFRDFKRHRNQRFDKDPGSKPELLVPDAAAQ